MFKDNYDNLSPLLYFLASIPINFVPCLLSLLSAQDQQDFGFYSRFYHVLRSLFTRLTSCFEGKAEGPKVSCLRASEDRDRICRGTKRIYQNINDECYNQNSPANVSWIIKQGGIKRSRGSLEKWVNR